MDKSVSANPVSAYFMQITTTTLKLLQFNTSESSLVPAAK